MIRIKISKTSKEKHEKRKLHMLSFLRSMPLVQMHKDNKRKSFDQDPFTVSEHRHQLFFRGRGLQENIHNCFQY